MADDADNDVNEQKKPIGGDLVIPIAGTAFTIYYISTIWESPWEAQLSAFFMGTILLILFAAITINTLRQVLIGRATLSLSKLAQPFGLIRKRLLLLLLTFGYLYLLPYGGFTLVSFVFLCSSLWVLNPARPLLRIAAISGSLSAAGFLLFVVAFRTPFPPGPIERLFAGAF